MLPVAAIDFGLTRLGFAPMDWSMRQGFSTLLVCTAPVFWLFFLLTGLSLFVLREKDRASKRPFSVPLYPVLPLIFCNTCVYMLYASTAYAGKLTLIGASPLVLGLPLYWLSRWRIAAPLMQTNEVSR